MNSERLNALALIIQTEMNSANILGKLQNVLAGLQNIVNQPQVPQHQQNLSKSLKELYPSLENAKSESLSPAWKEMLKEIGGADLLGINLRHRIEGIFSRNQITNAIALEEMRMIHNQFSDFKTGIDQVVTGLSKLRIGVDKLEPGECELGLFIPRTAVEDNFGVFAEELSEFSFIFSTFSEVITGKKDDLKIKTLSSSELLIFLKPAIKVAAEIATTVAALISAYKNLLDIKKHREGLKAQNLPEENLTGIDEYINSVIDNAVENIMDNIMQKWGQNISDQNRRNEMKNGIRLSLKKIVSRIDRGYHIEVRVEPLSESKTDSAPTENNETKNYIQTIQEAVKNLEYIKLVGAPVLKLPEKIKGN